MRSFESFEFDSRFQVYQLGFYIYIYKWAGEMLSDHTTTEMQW